MLFNRERKRYVTRTRSLCPSFPPVLRAAAQDCYRSLSPKPNCASNTPSVSGPAIENFGKLTFLPKRHARAAEATARDSPNCFSRMRAPMRIAGAKIESAASLVLRLQETPLSQFRPRFVGRAGLYKHDTRIYSARAVDSLTKAPR